MVIVKVRVSVGVVVRVRVQHPRAYPLYVPQSAVRI